MPYTSLASSALTIWRAIEHHGGDSRALFEQAGLDPDKLFDPDARYPDAAFFKLWPLAVEATGEPCLGVALVRFMHPSNFHALGYAWMASASLEDALQRLVRYFWMIIDKEELEWQETATNFRLSIHNPAPDHPTAKEDYDAFFALLVELCRTSYGADFTPLYIAMQRDPPPCPEVFSRYFRAPIDYVAPHNRIIFGKTELRRPLPTSNAELARTNDRIITEYLARFERSKVAVQVRAQLIEQLSSGHATQASIATALNLSLRSLQRKLKDEGTTFKRLLDETRRELASQYIGHSQLSLNEITFLLGFSELSNFSRAFKRWTGMAPSDYRLAH